MGLLISHNICFGWKIKTLILQLLTLIWRPGHEVIKLFSCCMKLILLINVKMPTNVGIFTFINRLNTTSECFKKTKALHSLNPQCCMVLDNEILSIFTKYGHSGLPGHVTYNTWNQFFFFLPMEDCIWLHLALICKEAFGKVFDNVAE